jgi:hypothetical protein
MNFDAAVRNILKDLPEDASPRAQWPTGDPRKQTAIETRCFEEGATIHFERLPPLQSWAPAVGMDMKRRTNFVVTNTVRLALEANVKLTQSEIDCIAESSAKNYRRGAWAKPVAALISGAAVYHGRETFRFPGFTPKSTWFSPSSFPTQRWVLVKGIRATYVWHAFRFLAYYPLVKFATTLFYSSIIRMSVAADALSDPRMSRINDTIMHRIAPNRMSRATRVPRSEYGDQAGGQAVGQSDSERRDESYRRVGLPPPSPEEVRRMVQQKRALESASTDQQDMQNPVEWGSSGSQPVISPPHPDKPSPRRSGLFGRTAPEIQSSPSRSKPVADEKSNLWEESDLFDDNDDASPVSAVARRAEREQSSRSQAQAEAQMPWRTSSWDRVRQQAKSDASPFSRGDRSNQDTVWGRLQQDAASTERDRERTPPSQNYSYSEAEEAKDYAKSQAQKDFDAMLEAERKGESDNGKRWR